MILRPEDATMRAGDVIGALGLTAHPEGGWYREVYRSSLVVDTPRGKRAAVTTIYYLLERAQLSRWHVVDADEIWHLYQGAPLELLTYDTSKRHLSRRVLAPVGTPTDASGPVSVVPAGVWQAARTLGDYSLAGCSVGPGFEFSDFRFVASLPDHADHFRETLSSLRALL